ncbi:adenosine deaminase [Candidatus Vecturithrix granuli]|uniref:Adenosine deaminase n=1 Tax=Vecturithrix granuli TaxID=1499967 RepID=A0A081C9M5_VECG1|nr:adenosine deaminase [Candidatus Vecturithrix granuli]
MSLTSFIQAMPKVELHVHLEGATRPETLLTLARRNHVKLPSDTVEGIRQWYAFTDFSHFIEVYLALCQCICTPEDIEVLTREFLQGQAAQHILYSEVTYTAFTHFRQHQLPFEEQLQAINRARHWAEQELGVSMGIVLDISRDVSPDEGMIIADWAIRGMGNGIVAFGLGGPEIGHPPEKFQAAFDRVRAAGLPSVPHAGEIAGPESMWGALRALHADRIGHGVRCLEDPELVAELRARQIPLEVCPTSNVCLKVAPDIASHPLPHLLDEGLYVTINSDDPPMFNTTLTEEYCTIAETFSFDIEHLQQFVLNAVNVSFLPEDQRISLECTVKQEFIRLKEEHHIHSTLTQTDS